jgi:hypothetical protein
VKNEEVTKEMESLDPVQRVDRARRVVESRVLSQEEFDQIQKRQIAKRLSADRKNTRGAKRSRPDRDDDADKDHGE